MGLEEEISEEIAEEFGEAKEVEELLETQAYSLYHVKKGVDQLLPVVLVLLVVVLYFEFFVHLSHAEHVLLVQVEKLLFAYFVIEIFLDFLLIESRREFFEEKWLDIVLVLPFFTLFREVQGALRLLGVVKPAKSVKAVKTVKPVKTSKAVKLTKLVKVQEYAKEGRGIQKAGKFVKKLRDLAISWLR